MCPIQLHFRLLISIVISFWFVIFHSSTFEIVSSHLIFKILRKQLLTNVWNLFCTILLVWTIFQRCLFASTVPFSSFDVKNSVDPLPQFKCFWNFFHERNGTWIETYGNLKLQDQGCMLGVVAVRILPIPEFLSWLFVLYEVLHSPAVRTPFRLNNAGCLSLKIWWTRSSCWE